jgi:hypothetical protein
MGEAALTACYLWNHSETSTLPPGITPYEMLNGHKPDLAHLGVFRAKCFVCIPTELQTKGGPHSHPTIFMGYSEGVKGYHLHARDDGAFFTVQDVIFDENLPCVTHHTDSDGKDDEPIIAVTPSAPIPTSIPLLSSPPVAEPHCSTRARIHTPVGQLFADELAVFKAHLMALCHARADRAVENSLHKGVTLDD